MKNSPFDIWGNGSGFSSAFGSNDTNKNESAFDRAYSSIFESKSDFGNSTSSFFGDTNKSSDSILNVRSANYGSMSIVDKMRGIQGNRLDIDGNVSLAEMYADSRLDSRVGGGVHNVTLSNIYQDESLYKAVHGLFTDGKITERESYLIDMESPSTTNSDFTQKNNGGFEGKAKMQISKSENNQQEAQQEIEQNVSLQKPPEVILTPTQKAFNELNERLEKGKAEKEAKKKEKEAQLEQILGKRDNFREPKTEEEKHDTFLFSNNGALDAIQRLEEKKVTLQNSEQALNQLDGENPFEKTNSVMLAVLNNKSTVKGIKQELEESSDKDEAIANIRELVTANHIVANVVDNTISNQDIEIMLAQMKGVSDRYHLDSEIKRDLQEIYGMMDNLSIGKDILSTKFNAPLHNMEASYIPQANKSYSDQSLENLVNLRRDLKNKIDSGNASDEEQKEFLALKRTINRILMG